MASGANSATSIFLPCRTNPWSRTHVRSFSIGLSLSPSLNAATVSGVTRKLCGFRSWTRPQTLEDLGTENVSGVEPPWQVCQAYRNTHYVGTTRLVSELLGHKTRPKDSDLWSYGKDGRSMRDAKENNHTEQESQASISQNIG